MSHINFADYPGWEELNINPTIHRAGSQQNLQMKSMEVQARLITWQTAEKGFVTLSLGWPICPWCYSLLARKMTIDHFNQGKCSQCLFDIVTILGKEHEPWEWIAILQADDTPECRWLTGGLI